jgi:hypothetical protein
MQLEAICLDPGTMNVSCSHFFNGVCLESTDVPWYYSYKPSLIDGVSDHHLALAAPIIAYWLLSFVFHYLDTRDWKVLERYRIHESSEVASRNHVSPTVVLIVVIFQQVLQTIFGLILLGQAYTLVPDHTEKVADIARQLELVVGSGEHVQPILASSTGGASPSSSFWLASSLSTPDSTSSTGTCTSTNSCSGTSTPGTIA